MFEQLRFYFGHSVNDLRTNQRLTIFALLSIAAGVAAIVSLQTLVIMIGDTLETNLQETNRGDISVQIRSLSPDDDDDDATIVADATDGDDALLTEQSVSIFGNTNTSYLLNQNGLDALASWLEDNYPAADVTYRQQLANEFQILTGGGTGTSITDPDSGDQLSQVNPIMIDPEAYPYYSDVRTESGDTLEDVLVETRDIVVSSNIARDLGVDVGASVQISGASETFTITGVVEVEQEVRNPAQDIFTGLFGFYYLQHDALTFFDDSAVGMARLYIQIEDATPERVAELDEALQERFPFFDTTNTEDLREDNEDLVEQIDQLMTTMGMVSVLLGSIGIVNTMQVIVRRRMLEIAVLKTIGLQGRQITLLFLTEALMMGVIGGLIGIIVGWAGTFAIKGVAESVFATTIPFRLALAPAVNGFFVGIVVSTVFGFLPTLAAGQVRPGLVIRPSDNVVPRAGILQTIFALLLIVFALAGVLTTITSYSYAISVGIVLGTFVVAGVIYIMLWALIWVVGRLLLLINVVDIKVSMRQMLATRRRGASTLLALVVGVFSLSLVTLFAESINNILEDALESDVGNILISVQNYNQLEDITGVLDTLDGVNDYTVQLGYTGTLVSFEESDTGETIAADEFEQYLSEQDINFPPFFDGTEEERLEIQQNLLEGALLETEISSYNVTNESSGTISAGRDLNADDAGEPVMVIQEIPVLDELGISVGDKLTYRFGGGGLNLFGDNDPVEITFEIVGVNTPGLSFNFAGSYYAPSGAFPDRLTPGTVAVFADVDDESIRELRQSMADVSGTFVLETSVFTQLIESLIGTFAAFPSLVATLGLVVGGVVIANSVALTTMERRKEIAVMKSVGLDRERVLGMLLLESAVLGLIGGLFGVGLGLVGVIAFASTGGLLTLNTIPIGIAFALMALCVGIAVIAALSSAWSASSEKPLTVLRHE